MIIQKIRDNSGNDRERKALLVSVYMGQGKLAACQEHLEELELLCETYGLEVLKKIPCGIKKYEASTYVTSGKLEELLAAAKEINAELVVFDDEISPAQQRNLEKAFGIPVIDRTEVIIGVFAQRAHSKDAQLQVEMARMKYQAPRLKRMWTHLSRQAATVGGGAYLKGAGEKQLEIDKRLIKSRIAQLQKEIDEVKAHRETQRGLRERSGIPAIAIIGYTNAGKSTLLNALTEAGVFVEDKLFATLDTTTRKFTLPNKQNIVFIDTVGFIRKLPHLLVAAFRSTLEEAVQADILLHLIDASHPAAMEQANAVYDVLKELGAENKSIITVLNKMDLAESSSMVTRLRIEYPKIVQISALQKNGLDSLLDRLEEELKKQRRTLRLRIPQKDYAVVSEVIRTGQVTEQEYDENDVLITVTLPAIVAGRLQRYLDEKAE